MELAPHLVTELPLVKKDLVKIIKNKLEQGTDYLENIISHIGVKNELVYDYIENHAKDRLLCARIYRLLELEGPLPRVNKFAGRDVQKESESTRGDGYLHILLKRLEKNPAVLDYLADYAISSRNGKAVLYDGSFVYRLLERQTELNIN